MFKIFHKMTQLIIDWRGSTARPDWLQKMKTALRDEWDLLKAAFQDDGKIGQVTRFSFAMTGIVVCWKAYLLFF